MQIGQVILDEKDILASLIKEVEPVRRNKQQHVMKIKFYTKEEKLELDAKEEIDENTAEKYMFIGSVNGPNSPQWYATSSSINYHISETIYNMSHMDFGESFNEKIKKLLNEYYIDLGENYKNKNRYMLNLYKFGYVNSSIGDLLKQSEEEINSKDEKKIIESVKKKIQKQIEEKLGISFNEISLFTIFIDDIPITNCKEYKEAVLKSKSGGKSKKPEEHKKCFMCGSTEDVTSKLSDMKIKYFTTNQVIFASGLSDYDKNMMLCKDCINRLLAGENYVQNNLDTRLMDFNVYLIPHFIWGKPLSKSELDSGSNVIKRSFNTVKNFNNIEDFKDYIENMKDSLDEDYYYLVNFFFYKKMNQATKVQKLIKDVNPSIFYKIAEASYETEELMQNILAGYRYNRISLESFYYFTPIRVKSGEAMQYRSLLQWYEAILTQGKIKKRNFINHIVQCTYKEYFNKEGYNIQKVKIHDTVIKASMAIKFLERMRIMDEEVKNLEFDLTVREDLKNYIKGLNYDEQKTSMFLLGYLVGEVGNAQYKRMGEDKKPILNKINFSGMDKQKVIRLSNEMVNKLKQEKILKYNEIVFGEHKRLFDKNEDKWKMNKQENLFYILSGYSYATVRPMINKNNGGNDNE